MLSRLISRTSSQIRAFPILISQKPQPIPKHNGPLPPQFLHHFLRPFSSNSGDNGGGNVPPPGPWTILNDAETSSSLDRIFADGGNDVTGSVGGREGEESWLKGDEEEVGDGALKGIEKAEADGSSGDGWLTAEGYKPWTIGKEEDGKDVFDIGESVGGGGAIVGLENEEARLKEREKEAEERMRLEAEEKQLAPVLQGPNRAFGDLIAASGITDEMLDSLIALKDFRDVEGLPPLTEIEDMRYDRSLKKSTRAEIERQKQEEVAKSRVRQVDDKGRAYGTGRRKCSIARVWIQPGDGKFMINDKEFDVYFPMLDHRATLLRPFTETKTLGLWDVDCTVKGGGVSGQVGAIRLGVSRALQNWEPGLRPALRSEGFLTRDPRVVERKKPGKAKARKSFQWVKR
ncbi:hypothetical protein MLD38_012772 [Melastoma candidum]|uniref:Uncharacterized protein n=1 Tax=Melastoma candidum TaxID=119954 RepID=A0ACB9RB21_9MYRT|nr:hypothetical protein MLD38_012772 [Melastoma candidum]